MQTVQVTLDEQTAATAATSANADGYGTVGDYVRALVEADQRRRDAERLEAKLVDAVDSGDAVEMTPGDWAHIRGAVRQRLSREALD